VRSCCRQRCRQRALIQSRGWLWQGSKYAGRRAARRGADCLSADGGSGGAGAVAVGDVFQGVAGLGFR
jgi:hypothetical protein